MTMATPPDNLVGQAHEEAATIRCFINGCFDLLHIGHLNALRQVKHFSLARLLSDSPDKCESSDDSIRKPAIHVVAGIHANEEIRRVKGGAFMNSEQEKERLLKACRFVDEVIHDIPYGVIKPEVYGCDFVMHGDDEIMLDWSVLRDADAEEYFRFCEKEKSAGDVNLHQSNLVGSLDSPLESNLESKVDMYWHAKHHGKFRYIRRTEGISTT